MAPRASILGGSAILLDWDARDPDGIINAKASTRQEWEAGVNQTLTSLYREPPCRTSAAVIDEIIAAGNKRKESVTIIPWTRKSWETPLAGRHDDKLNAGATPVDYAGATTQGKRSDELPDWIIRQIADTPPGEEREKLIKKYTGNAGGSSSRIFFTAQDWAPSTSSAGLDATDETLLHELVHAMRQMKGQEEPDPLTPPFDMKPQSQFYDTLEDFAAIIITNVYRSENNRGGLRQDHRAGPDGKDRYLGYPLTNARNFMTVWRPQLTRLQAELPWLCAQIAEVDCHFNPFFELYDIQGRFQFGSRRVAS